MQDVSRKMTVLALVMALPLILVGCTDQRRRPDFGAGENPADAYKIKKISLGSLTPEQESQLTALALARCAQIQDATGTIRGACTIVAADGYALTTTDVTPEFADYFAVLRDGAKVVARVIARNPTNDIALLHLEGQRPCDYFAMRELPTDYDQTVFAASPAPSGAPLAAGFLSGMRISQWRTREQFWYHTLLHSAPVFPADVGGPLLDAQGQLIGIHAGRSGRQSVAITTAALLEMWDALRAGGDVAGVRPATPELEAEWVVPGLVAFAVRQSGVLPPEPKTRQLLARQDKYRELYLFLKSQEFNPADKFVAIVSADALQN